MQLDKFHEQMQSQAESLGKTSSTTSQRILETLQEEQKRQFRIQLIALDMKKRAFDVRAEQLAQQCLERYDELLQRSNRFHPNPQQVASKSKLLHDPQRQANSLFRPKPSQPSQPTMKHCRTEDMDSQHGQEVVLIPSRRRNAFPIAANVSNGDEFPLLNTTSLPSSDEESNDSTTVAPPVSPPRRTRMCFLGR
jgi:hypothetical protein